MNLFILDEDHKIVEIIDDFETLIWHTKYYKLGFFELTTAIRYIKAIKQGKYLYRPDSMFTGKIDKILTEDGMVTISGNFLERLLDFRVCQERKTYQGTVEDVMYNIVKDSCIENKPIKHLVLGESQSRGERISVSLFGKSIAEYLYTLCEIHNFSFNINIPLGESKNTVFEVFQGKDRTQSQNDNSWAVFSRSFENVISELYETNRDDYNVAHVYGGGTGVDREYVLVDYRKPDDELRELFVDARDLQQEENESIIVYRERLRERGREKLEERGVYETIDCQTVEFDNMPFALGDICTYISKDIDEIFEIQATEIVETHEARHIETRTTFGKYELGVVESMKRGVYL